MMTQQDNDVETLQNVVSRESRIKVDYLQVSTDCAKLLAQCGWFSMV